MKKTALTALCCLCCSFTLQAAAPKQKMAKFIRKEMDFAVLQSRDMYAAIKDQEGRLVNTAQLFYCKRFELPYFHTAWYS